MYLSCMVFCEGTHGTPSPHRTWFEQPCTFPRCLTLFCPLQGCRMLVGFCIILLYMNFVAFNKLTCGFKSFDQTFVGLASAVWAQSLLGDLTPSFPTLSTCSPNPPRLSYGPPHLVCPLCSAESQPHLYHLQTPVSLLDVTCLPLSFIHPPNKHLLTT